jgi:hypothetical protein
MVDNNVSASTQSNGDNQRATNSTNQAQNPRKDHYSYSYTYKTADPESGIPGLSSVEVNHFSLFRCLDAILI